MSLPLFRESAAVGKGLFFWGRGRGGEYPRPLLIR